jgi:methylated-DNA-protein-cysteine methyltransferase-like protein
MMVRPFEDAVVEIVDSIPRGETSTYGEVAAEAGYPGAARAVGNVMRTVPGLAWWRVIAASGRLVPGLEVEHTQRLRSEGVLVKNGRVSMGGDG